MLACCRVLDSSRVRTRVLGLEVPAGDALLEPLEWASALRAWVKVAWGESSAAGFQMVGANANPSAMPTMPVASGTASCAGFMVLGLPASLATSKPVSPDPECAHEFPARGLRMDVAGV